MQNSISPDEFGRSLKSHGFNLLVVDIESEVAFSKEVLLAEILYHDDNFVALKRDSFVWMIHHDRTYQQHPLSGFINNDVARGIGIELHLYEHNPDEGERIARARNDVILAGSMDKPHGLREVFIISPAGYVWVLSKPLPEKN